MPVLALHRPSPNVVPTLPISWSLYPISIHIEVQSLTQMQIMALLTQLTAEKNKYITYSCQAKPLKLLQSAGPGPGPIMWSKFHPLPKSHWLGGFGRNQDIIPFIIF